MLPREDATVLCVRETWFLCVGVFETNQSGAASCISRSLSVLCLFFAAAETTSPSSSKNK